MVQNALRVVEQAVGERLKPVGKIVQFPPHKKGPAAVALGKLGGHEGAFLHGWAWGPQLYPPLLVAAPKYFHSHNDRGRDGRVEPTFVAPLSPLFHGFPILSYLLLIFCVEFPANPTIPTEARGRHPFKRNSAGRKFAPPSVLNTRYFCRQIFTGYRRSCTFPRLYC